MNEQSTQAQFAPDVSLVPKMPGPLDSRYASREEAISPEFMELNRRLSELGVRYGLPDHAGLNKQRFPWAPRMPEPETYASRLWEYPWALRGAMLARGMKCADVGCGQSTLTLALRDLYHCDVTGFDPDYGGVGGGYYSHGVSDDYAARTGLSCVRAGVESLPVADDTFDRVFCISVIEHIEGHHIVIKGIQEIARVLRPNGLALVSVDVGMMKRIVDPLELVWESGLSFAGGVDLGLPKDRFGILMDGRSAVDVFGLVLMKRADSVHTAYDANSPTVESWRAALLRDSSAPEWPDKVFHKWHLDDGMRDWYRDRRPNGTPSIKTALRLMVKTLLGRYPASPGNSNG